LSKINRDDAEEYTESLGYIGAGWWRQIYLAEKLGVPKAMGLSLREWVDDHLGGYIRLTLPERREAVAELTAEGMSSRQVADVLGVSHNTAAKDLRSVTSVTPEEQELSADEAGLVSNVTPPRQPKPKCTHCPIHGCP
jgi:hypothetical protein